MSINISENGKEVPVDSFWHFVEILWSVATGLTKKAEDTDRFKQLSLKIIPALPKMAKIPFLKSFRF